MFRLDTRGVAIVLGCTAALIAWAAPRARVDALASNMWVRSATMFGALGLWCFGTLLFYRHGWQVVDIHRYLDVPLEVMFCGQSCVLWYGPRDIWDRMLSFRPLAYIGLVSYGLYVYHRVVQVLVWDFLTPGLLPEASNEVRYAIRFLLFFGLAFGSASLSYHYFETPFLKLKRFFRAPEAVAGTL